MNDSVEPPGSQKGGIDHPGRVRGTNYDNAFPSVILLVVLVHGFVQVVPSLDIVQTL